MVVNRVVNCRQFKEYILFGLEECARRIGNPKQKLRRDRKKGIIYERTLHLTTTRIILINNTNNLFQQYCAQNNTLGAQGFVKDNGRQFNCQLKSIRGYPNNIRGNGHRKIRTNARPLAKAKQNEEIDNNHKCQVIYKSHRILGKNRPKISC